MGKDYLNRQEKENVILLLTSVNLLEGIITDAEARGVKVTDLKTAKTKIDKYVHAKIGALTPENRKKLVDQVSGWRVVETSKPKVV